MAEGWHISITGDREEKHYYRNGGSLCGRRVYFGDDLSDNGEPELGVPVCSTCTGMHKNQHSLKFVCPACGKEADIKAVRASACINEVLQLPIVEGAPLDAEPVEVRDWVTLHYECANCGVWLPVCPAYNEHGDGPLIEYLKRLPNNQEKKDV